IGRLHCVLPWWGDATVDFMNIGGYNVSAKINKVQKETLIIWGEDDQIIDSKLAVVENLTVNQLCQSQVIVAINRSLLTIRWHGVLQRLTQWEYGPEFITQCPIRTESNCTYKFKTTTIYTHHLQRRLPNVPHYVDWKPPQAWPLGWNLETYCTCKSLEMEKLTMFTRDVRLISSIDQSPISYLYCRTNSETLDFSDQMTNAFNSCSSELKSPVSPFKTIPDDKSSGKIPLSFQASACSLSTLHFLKFPENSFEVLKLLENSVEVLNILKNKLELTKIPENKLESLKLQENRPGVMKKHFYRSHEIHRALQADPSYKTWTNHDEPNVLRPVIHNTTQPQMRSDMTACLNDLIYIPPNNEQNEPTQGDIGETSNKPTQAIRREFEELYASANEELYPGCDYVTRLDFMAKFTYDSQAL
nr:alpha/beta hydrolase fold-1 [Tanacetum cinerariifolium]